jgi:hypothetical protein
MRETRQTETKTDPEELRGPRYDYDRQCWLARAGVDADGTALWAVIACSHPHAMHPGCCYAGAHAGEVVRHHEEIH